MRASCTFIPAHSHAQMKTLALLLVVAALACVAADNTTLPEFIEFPGTSLTPQYWYYIAPDWANRLPQKMTAQYGWKPYWKRPVDLGPPIGGNIVLCSGAS
jgi:hypothetical protein